MSQPYDGPAYWRDDAVRARAESFIDSIIALNVSYGMGRCDDTARERAINAAARRALDLSGWGWTRA